MELSPHGFLEELLQAPRRDSWTNFPIGATDQFFSNGWNFDSFDENTTSLTTTTNPSFVGCFSSTPTTAEAATAAPPPGFECPFSAAADQTYPFVDGYTVVPPEMNTSSPFPATQEEYSSMVHEDEDQYGLLSKLHFEQDSKSSNCCKVELEVQQQQEQQGSNTAHHVFNMGLCGEHQKKSSSSKSKKLEGQPSKNLMAERRRRKRLNDRLSMLRSIVPKISKMDRTSILGDTIDYMKELLERINKLQEEDEAESEEDNKSDTIDQMKYLMNNLKELKPSEQVLVRNSPKFHVERRDVDTRIDICCATKPGLLLSTVNTLEALGLEIQQCVISCFNDFSMQASCAEVEEQRRLLSPEDIKQALFRTAGYGGRCM